MKPTSPKKSASKAMNKTGAPGNASVSAKDSTPAPAERPQLPKKPAVPAIPPILLEGDEPSPPKVSGPGERYALGQEPAAAEGPGEMTELPESYGTQRLLLTARDPHWLYAHWDLTREQLKRYNGRSVDRHLVLRVYRNEVSGEPFREIHVHPESRNWFAHVGMGGAKFVAELGYYRPNDQWVAIATSGSTVTPPDTVSDDLSVWFETLPVDMRFEDVLRLVKAAVADHVPLMEALQQLRASGMSGLPDLQRAEPTNWTADQERALAQIVSMDSVRRVWMGSLEITELIRRQFLRELSSQAAAQLGETGSWSGAVSSFSSPFGGKEQQKGFWFNVNAELIIYGATERDATVTIGGRTIKLRSDGSFSYRFALPDGQYDLPAVATSSDGTDSRSAELKFSRSTQYRGEVQQHPQDPALKPPRAEHVA
jgi:hypothetical protein